MPEPIISKTEDSHIARKHPVAFLAGYGLFALVVAVAATWMFLVLADEVPEKGWMARLDTTVSAWLQAHGTETGESIFVVVSLFGAPILAAILVGTFAWLVRRRQWLRATALAVTTGGGAGLNALLKGTFQRARPAFASEFHARSWSFPSGHAMAALIGYGFLAALMIRWRPARRRLIIAAAAVIIGLIGFARIYLGVHYLSDVLAGYCAGAVWLTACIAGFRFARRRVPMRDRITIPSILAVAATLAVVAPRSIQAQTTTVGDSIHAAKTLFTWRDAVLAVGFTGLTVAMYPVDRSVARRLQDSSTQANHFLRNASRNIEYLADPGSIVIGVGMYAVGRAGKWRDVADLGLHGTEAVAVSGVLTGIIKAVAGRSRPFVTADTNPHDFALFRGRSNGAYQSFPSGHTTAAFAAAAAVTSESQRWWPGGVWVVAPLMYGGATMVGLSRMYHNVHWASDVALGAAIGTFTGIKVVRYSHGHPRNPIDRVLLGLRAGTNGNGDFTVTWSP